VSRRSVSEHSYIRSVHDCREEYRRESDKRDGLPHILPERLRGHTATEEGQLADILLPFFVHVEERHVLLVDSEFLAGGASAVVCCLNDKKVHADQDGDEDQGRDSERSFKGNVLDDCAGDGLTMELLDRAREIECKGLPEKHTRSKHTAPDTNTCTSLVDKIHVRHGRRDKGL
jgi:hypothetical protein